MATETTEKEKVAYRYVADTKKAYDAIVLAVRSIAGLDDISTHAMDHGDPLVSRAPRKGPRFMRRRELSEGESCEYQTILASIDRVKGELGDWWDRFVAYYSSDSDTHTSPKPRRRDPDLLPRLEAIAWRCEWTYRVEAKENKTERVTVRVEPSVLEAVKETGEDVADFIRAATVARLMELRGVENEH